MPLNIWTRDQVPELTFSGLASLGGGIGVGIDSIGKGLEKRAEERKRLAQAGKAADLFMKSLPEDQLPIPADEWALMSAVDKASAMHGIIGASQYQRAVADTKRFLAAAAREQAQSDALAREPAFLQEVSRYSEPGQLPYNIAPEEFERYALPEGQTQPGLREFSAAASRTKYPLDLKSVDDLLRAAGGAGDLTVHPPVTQELPGGMMSYGFPGTKVRGVYPDVTKALETQEFTDANGNVHTMIVPPKGALKELETKGKITPESIHRRLTATYTALIARRKYEDAAKIQKQLEALERGEEPSEAVVKAATVSELPRTKEGKVDAGKLTKGTAYNSAQGVVTWDGEKFVKE